MSIPSRVGSTKHPAIERADAETALPRHFNAIAVVIVMVTAIASYFYPWGFAQ